MADAAKPKAASTSVTPPGREPGEATTKLPEPGDTPGAKIPDWVWPWVKKGTLILVGLVFVSLLFAYGFGFNSGGSNQVTHAPGAPNAAEPHVAAPAAPEAPLIATCNPKASSTATAQCIFSGPTMLDIGDGDGFLCLDPVPADGKYTAVSDRGAAWDSKNPTRARIVILTPLPDTGMHVVTHFIRPTLTACKKTN